MKLPVGPSQLVLKAGVSKTSRDISCVRCFLFLFLFSSQQQVGVLLIYKYAFWSILVLAQVSVYEILYVSESALYVSHVAWSVVFLAHHRVIARSIPEACSTSDFFKE